MVVDIPEYNTKDQAENKCGGACHVFEYGSDKCRACVELLASNCNKV